MCNTVTDNLIDKANLFSLNVITLSKKKFHLNVSEKILRQTFEKNKVLKEKK